MVIVIVSSVIFAAGVACWICSLILRKSNKIGKNNHSPYDSARINAGIVKREKKREKVF